MATITCDLSATFGALTLSGAGVIKETGSLSVTLGALTLASSAERSPFIVSASGARVRRIARNLRLQTALNSSPKYASRTKLMPRLLTERNRAERLISVRKRSHQLDTTLNGRMFPAISRAQSEGVAQNTTPIDDGSTIVPDGIPTTEVYYNPFGPGA